MPHSLCSPSSAARVLAWGAASACLLVAGEAALRASGFVHRRGLDRQLIWSAARDPELVRGDGLYGFDATCLWSPRVHAPIPWNPGEHINSHGFRGPDVQFDPRPGVLRIVTLGGATTLGVGVTWEETYSAQLVALLAEKGVRAEVLCAGAEEHTIVQGLERWREALRMWKPDVLVCAFTGNSESRPAVLGRRDIVRIAEIRGIPRSSRGPNLRDDLRLLHLASWLRDLASNRYWEEKEFEYDARRRAPTFRALDWPGERRVPYDEFVRVETALAHECLYDGIAMILLSIPRAPGLEPAPVIGVYQSGAAEVARINFATVVRGNEVIQRTLMEESSPPEDMFLGEFSLSSCGHAAIARALAEEILSRREHYR